MLPRVTEAVERALAAAEAEGSRTNAFLTVARERAMARAAAVPEGAPP
jgi:Asp-tRNA(Asn)/Glu-tRNA(Gln) amidotransferase A subunit family amidase